MVLNVDDLCLDFIKLKKIMDNNYTSKNVAEILGVSDKSVRRYLNSYFSIENGAYKISDKMLEILKEEYLNIETRMVVQEFTQGEYDEFHKRLSEYPFLKERINDIVNDMEYYRKSMISKEKQMEMLLGFIQQRNYIEAKEKKID